MNGRSVVRKIGRFLAIGLFCVPLPTLSGDALAHLGAGLKLFDEERYLEAAKEFKQALESDASLVEASYHLAVCSFNVHEYPQARKQFQRLLDAGYQKDWDTYYLGRLDLVEGNLDSGIRRFQSLVASQPFQDELYYLGSAFLSKGEPEKAISPLLNQILFNHADFRAHYLLARAYMKTGNPREAEREFQESDRLHQYYSQVKKDLMDCRSNLSAGQADEAWAICGPVLQTDDIDKLTAVGMIFGEFGFYERALQLFQRALVLDPDSPEINYDAAFTYYRKKDYPRARHYLEASLQRRPDFFEALVVYGTVLYLMREDAAAGTVLGKAHRLRPDDAAVSKLLAQIQNATPQ
jgi:tetratricopeptide (TPR) repeat protein